MLRLARSTLNQYTMSSVASDDPRTVVAARGRAIDVLSLEDGRLSSRFSFPRLHSRIDRFVNDIVHVSKSLAYVRGRYSRQIEVYNILNGDLTRKFDPKARVIRSSTNGIELFFGFNAGRNGAGIRVYRL